MESSLHRNHLLALLPEADRLALTTQADIVSTGLTNCIQSMAPSSTSIFHSP